MRKLLLGIGILLVGRYVARNAPQGWRRHLSLRALVGATLASAANGLLSRPNRKPAHAAPPQGV